jgi:NAD(P) transhydrogenase subunit alpha
MRAPARVYDGTQHEAAGRGCTKGGDDDGSIGRRIAMTLDLTTALFVFMLATFLGMDIIRRVSRLLHTPLMSLTNAISSIAVIGAVIIAGQAHDSLSTWLGAIAVFASTTNLVSGYLITDRMLRMFRRREAPRS